MNSAEQIKKIIKLAELEGIAEKDDKFLENSVKKMLKEIRIPTKVSQITGYLVYFLLKR